MTNSRSISQIIEPQYVIEGAGVLLRRSIAPHKSNPFDPFLLFDHFAFNDPVEGPIRGFPMHPHRGIETVTYMLEGSTHHRDSLGNAGLIGPGDVQWMTSGRGILHEEMPRRGPSGNIYGFQLWVNLPARLKMTEPRYQEVSAQTIPTYEKDGIKIRVVAGGVDGVIGPVTETLAPRSGREPAGATPAPNRRCGGRPGASAGVAASPLYLDVQLAPDTEFIQPVPSGHTALAYVFEGEGVFVGDPHPSGTISTSSGQAVEAVHLVKFEDGDQLRVKTEKDSVRFMLMAGKPFKEPIAPYGPFVMNTMEEIQQTLVELRNGTFIK